MTISRIDNFTGKTLTSTSLRTNHIEITPGVELRRSLFAHTSEALVFISDGYPPALCYTVIE